MDPTGKSSDNDIIRALDRVQLWSIISETDGNLSAQMDVDVWSAGQKQLLCLARAMEHAKDGEGSIDTMMKSDEQVVLTAKTEALMQDTIDEIFQDCIIIAIMHRLTHITRYDEVAVVDEGHLMEHGAPQPFAESRLEARSIRQAEGVN
ncbi:ABC transporter [Beauveria bassiana ARSEF 2860]|uniref:ABC transporter n=1 Tax=Beauveria bassiana (strain ARSEF 2860) TaxID=655819 RepID=J4KLE4_BEAB2|nr:ABC transporter [Beauveria bassiana ARSEF 2860]EJP62059.1 ABC transporter [Beauveria bassiana ARSEF 2860]